MCECDQNLDVIDDVKIYKSINIQLPEALEACLNDNVNNPKNLINVLHKVQEEYGYIPAKLVDNKSLN